MLLLKHTKCYDHMEASMGLDKLIQPAQLLGLSSGPKFCECNNSHDTVKTPYNVIRYNRIFNIRHKIAGNGSVSI